LVRVETIALRVESKLDRLLRLLREEPLGEDEFPDANMGSH
jgi:hypothetical protein